MLVDHLLPNIRDDRRICFDHQTAYSGYDKSFVEQLVIRMVTRQKIWRKIDITEELNKRNDGLVRSKDKRRGTPFF